MYLEARPSIAMVYDLPARSTENRTQMVVAYALNCVDRGEVEGWPPLQEKFFALFSNRLRITPARQTSKEEIDAREDDSICSLAAAGRDQMERR